VRQRRRRAVRRRTAGRPAKPGAQHRRCFCCPGRRSGCRGHQDLNRHCRRGARRARRARSQTCQGRGRGAAKSAAKAVQAESSAADKAANQKVYDQKNGATDVGVSKDEIKLGSVTMHGMALGNVIAEPVVRGNFAALSAVNDRGGVLGRRLSITDCDDGPGEVSRAKACIKKLVGQDQHLLDGHRDRLGHRLAAR